MGLETLGVHMAPAELQCLTAELDPDASGHIEYRELRNLLLQTAGMERQSSKSMARQVTGYAQNMIVNKPRVRKLTPKEAEALRQKQIFEAKCAQAAINESIYAFEKQLGLSEPGEKPPVGAAALRRAAEDERRQLSAGSRGTDAAPKPQPRGPMSRIEPICIRPVPTRPDTAPARERRALAASRRNQETYEYWLREHGAAIEAHTRAVEKARADAIAEHKQRVGSRRDAMVTTLRTKRQEATQGAVTRQEPFWKRRELSAQQQVRVRSARERALSQPIVFLPDDVVRNKPSLTPDRLLPDFNETVSLVHSLR